MEIAAGMSGEVEEEEQELNHPLLPSHLLDKVGW